MACSVEVRDGRGRMSWLIRMIEAGVFDKRPPSLSRRAVERRVAHRLLSEYLLLRKCSPRSRWHSALGDYYLVSMVHGCVHETHQNLEDLARKHDVIGEGQTIAEK